MLEPVNLCCSSVTRRLPTDSRLAKIALLALLGCGVASLCLAQGGTEFSFNLARGPLGEALQRVAVQSNLQLVYAQGLIEGRRSPRIKGELTVDAALGRLLAGTGLSWRYISDVTVAIYRESRTPRTAAEPVTATPQSAATAGTETVTLSDVDIRADRRWLADTTSSSTFGFNKSPLETPRTVSYIGDQAIDAFSLSAVEDLARLAPGVFTTTRFGIQGSVDVRNVPGDTYFRGMKRLTLQGHGRSVLAALDSIEVVGGPPSPLYGMGKIGGYTNVVPKSGRAQTGKYLQETQGFMQATGGQYDRREVSFGAGGPLTYVGNGENKQGGYYVYGLVEDSKSYAEDVPIRQLVLQAAANVDDLIGPFRLETGINYQESRTSGALIGRLTQEMVDSGRYISGSPLVNLDLNGNGSIDYLEMQTASPVRGSLTASNQPLAQVWAWPRDASGNPLPLNQFPKVAGIPQAVYTYLAAHPEADPTGLLRAQGVGGPLPVSGAVPIGLFLDPRTVRYSTLNPRHSSAYERDSRALFITAYADLVKDQNPDFTVKNQLFFDSMHQYKLSNQPLNLLQDVTVLEDKATATLRIRGLPSWLHVNSLLSINLRDTISTGHTTTPASDFSNHRADAASPDWGNSPGGLTANTTFDYEGLPLASIYRTEFSEIGGGLLFDIELLSGTNLLIGGRIDGSHARNTDYAGRFNLNTGTSAKPGAYVTTDDSQEGWDSRGSWSLSLSQTLPYGLHPYMTLARSSIMLDGNNNSLTNATIRAGHVGSAGLRELGLKASLLQGRLLLTSALYEQGRTEVGSDDDAALLSAYATATTTRGWQTELKWAPLRHVLLSLYTLRLSTEYTPNMGATIQVDARSLGFQDVIDASGRVVYPAEAFLYGGRVRIVLPDNMPQYKKKQGVPDTQVGISAIYKLPGDWGVTAKGNYLSRTCSGRLCLVTLPQSTVFDAGIFWESGGWNLKFDVFNLTDRHNFRARTGDTLGDVIAQAMPGRRWQLTAKYKF